MSDPSETPPVEGAAGSVPPTPEPAAVVHPADTPTLLETAQVKEPPKVEPVEPIKAVEPEPPKPVEAKPPEPSLEPPKPEPTPLVEPAPVEYKYVLPETLKMDEALRGEAHKAFDAFRANPTEGVQGLIDLHNKQLTSFVEDYKKQAERHQIEAFNSTRAGWVKEVQSDPLIGGAGHETAMGVVARMRDKFVSDGKPGSDEYKSDMDSFNRMLRITGVGEHPAFLKFLYRVGNDFDEPTAPGPPGKPPPDIGKRPPGRLRDVYTRS